jgi:hypothetical protein
MLRGAAYEGALPLEVVGRLVTGARILAEIGDGSRFTVFIEPIHVKVRDGKGAKRPIYTAVAGTVEGERDILSLWADDGGEGAKISACSPSRIIPNQ